MQKLQSFSAEQCGSADDTADAEASLPGELIFAGTATPVRRRGEHSTAASVSHSDRVLLLEHI